MSRQKPRVAIIVAWAALAISIMLGCRCDKPVTPRPGVQCVGTLSKLGPDVTWEDLHVEPASGAEAPAPELAERVNGIRAQHSGLEVAYSKDGASALLYPPNSGTGQMSMWLVSASCREHVSVRMLPDLDVVDVPWSADGRQVVVLTKPRLNRDRLQLEVFPVACLELTDDGKPKVHIGSRLADSYYWDVVPFNSDGSVLFLRDGAGRTGEEIWTLALPDCEFSLLYEQPPPRYPPSVQRSIRKEGFMGAPSRAAGEVSFSMPLPSPSGKFLLFDAYSPDTCYAHALWLVNLETRQSRMVTWEDKEYYKHYLIRWNEGEGSFLFQRPEAEGHGYYQLTLDPDLWAPGSDHAPK